MDGQIREKNHQTSKVWAFWAMYVGCPDKIHLCWKKCSTEYQIHIGTWGYEESKSKSLKNYYWIKFQLKLVILDQWTQYIAEWDGYEVNLCHWKQMLGCEKFSRAAHAQPHLKKNFARTFARTSSFRQSSWTILTCFLFNMKAIKFIYSEKATKLAKQSDINDFIQFDGIWHFDETFFNFLVFGDREKFLSNLEKGD